MNKKFKVKNIIIISFVILLFVVIIPIIINESYKHGYLYSTVWTGADMLMFYGSMFSGLGSIILGIIAFYQNKKFKEENDIAQTRIEQSNKESQERLERINEKSNEINSKNIIISNLVEQFNQEKNILNEFFFTFSEEQFLNRLFDEEGVLSGIALMQERHNLYNQYSNIIINIRSHKVISDKCEKFKKSLLEYSECLMDIIDDKDVDIRGDFDMQQFKLKMEKCEKLYYDCLKCEKDYLAYKQSFIDELLLKDHTLNEIKMFLKIVDNK